MRKISLYKSGYGTIIIADVYNRRNNILLDCSQSYNNIKYIRNYVGWNFDVFNKVGEFDIEIDNNNWIFDSNNNILCVKHRIMRSDKYYYIDLRKLTDLKVGKNLLDYSDIKYLVDNKISKKGDKITLVSCK